MSLIRINNAKEGKWIRTETKMFIVKMNLFSSGTRLKIGLNNC